MQGTTRDSVRVWAKTSEKINIFLNFIQDKALDGINPPDTTQVGLGIQKQFVILSQQLISAAREDQNFY